MIHFLTGNKDKVKEVISILGDGNVQQLQVDLPEIQEIDPHKIIEEKLKEAQKHHDGEFMVEDTSLYLEALNNRLPGPLIKWFEKGIGNEGIVNLTESLGNPRATAVDLIGYIDDKGEINFFEGRLAGTIVKPRGEKDYGWGPIFVPEGTDKTFSEMTAEEKNRISHRRIALEKFKEFISKR